MKKINLFLLTGIVFLSSCVVKKIKVYEENQAIKFLDETQKYTSTTRDDYVLLDLRDLNNSFAKEHFVGFINYDINNGSFEELMQKLIIANKQDTIFIIDEKGKDVIRVAEYLKKCGYKKIIIYLGGYENLRKNNSNYFTTRSGIEDCDC